MSFHFSLIEALGTFAYIIIFGFFWRTYAARNPETSLGKAMSFIY